ncbi:hypothetical protein GCM10028775_74250 [Catellatospora paridis]
MPAATAVNSSPASAAYGTSTPSAPTTSDGGSHCASSSDRTSGRASRFRLTRQVAATAVCGQG